MFVLALLLIVSGFGQLLFVAVVLSLMASKLLDLLTRNENDPDLPHF